MIPPDQFLRAYIRPVCSHLSRLNDRFASPAAEKLLLGTAIIESKMEEIYQRGGGPAVSMMQIERETFEDVYERYLWIQRQDLYALVNDFKFHGATAWDQLAGNQHLAVAIARIKYWMAPDPLPAADDLIGLGQYYDRVYHGGNKGYGPRWVYKYQKHVK